MGLWYFGTCRLTHRHFVPLKPNPASYTLDWFKFYPVRYLPSFAQGEVCAPYARTEGIVCLA